MAILQKIIKEEDTPAPIIQANPDTLDYNSTREGVKMPEYGRFVQEW